MPRRASFAGARGEIGARFLVRGESSNASVKPPLLEWVWQAGVDREGRARCTGGAPFLRRPWNDKRPESRRERAARPGRGCGLSPLAAHAEQVKRSPVGQRHQLEAPTAVGVAAGDRARGAARGRPLRYGAPGSERSGRAARPDRDRGSSGTCRPARAGAASSWARSSRGWNRSGCRSCVGLASSEAPAGRVGGLAGQIHALEDGRVGEGLIEGRHALAAGAGDLHARAGRRTGRPGRRSGRRRSRRSASAAAAVRAASPSP